MTASRVLDTFHAQLKELERLTLCLGAETPFGRTEDENGEIISVLVPDERQRMSAEAHYDRLLAWRAGVTAVLRRRGGAAAVRLEKMVAMLSTLVRLEREDVADITETRWRTAFAAEVSRAVLQLARLLDDCADAFAVRERRRPRRYDPFVLTVEAVAADEWRIGALSTAGSACENVRLLLGAVEAMRLDRNLLSRRIELPLMIDRGRTLFTRCLPRSLAALYFHAREQAIARGHGLHLAVELERAGVLAGIPWELMHDGDSFIALAAATPVTRCTIAAKRAVAGGGAPRPLRVLLITSSPSSFQYINPEKEQNLVRAAVAPLVSLEELRLDVAPEGTMNTLRRLLQAADDEEEPYHVLHFAGHGRFNRTTRRGELLMTGPGGEAHAVGRSQLNALFREHPALRLVVLNACETAQQDDVFHGVATTLLASGVGAVVAMQLEITGPVAALFAEEFYGALADGVPVEAAVTEARRGIFFRGHPVEWVTPVLFLSGGNAMTGPFAERPSSSPY